MATYQKRNGKWRAIIRRVGQKPVSKTFTNKALAEAWARQIEHKLDKGDLISRPKGTVAELFERYREEVADKKKGGRWERVRLTAIERDIGHAKLDGDLVGELLNWRNKRLIVVKPASVARDMAVISAVFTHAIKEWRINVINPTSYVKWPPAHAPRKRLISIQEQEDVLKKFGFDDTKKPQVVGEYIPWVFIFALETAMRLGEILNLRWGGVHEKYVEADGKTGPRLVPLSKKARWVIENMPKVDDRVFPVRAATFDVLWRRVRPEWMTFHDSRATALTRMSKLMPPMELAKISGHKDLNMLLNTYYRPSVDDLTRYFD